MTRTTGVIALTLLVTVLGCDKQPVAPSVPGSAAASPAPPQTTPLNTPFAFTTSRNNTEVIYVVDREGGEERRLTTGRAPDLSRDGRIAYESVGGGKREGIFVINDDGTGERFVGEGWDPSWSPDGHYVAVTRYRQGIYVLDVDGASEPRVAARPPAGYEFVLNTAWSPDGGEIAFSACNETSDKWDVYNVCGPLYVVAPDGSSPAVALSMPGNAQSPAWSPDGRRLAFCVRRIHFRSHARRADYAGGSRRARASVVDERRQACLRRVVARVGRGTDYSVR